MLIDSHVHIFPEQIVAVAINRICLQGGSIPYADGTADGTLKKMDEWGVDKAVVLNIATNPQKQRKVNDAALRLRSDRLLPLGSVHPYAEDALSEVDYIGGKNMVGIKLHAEYQGFDLLEDKAQAVYQRCQEKGLLIYFHSGGDLAYPGSFRTSTERVLEILHNFPKLQLILAHLGAFRMWDEVYRDLCGTSACFDISFAHSYVNGNLFLKILNKHGSEKILFGSDCPWQSAKDTYDYLKSFNLPQEDFELICSGNAKRIFGI